MSSLKQFSMADPAVTQYPFAYYEAMRKEAPVHKDPGTGFYWISRYDDVVKAAMDAGIFSSKNEINLKKIYRPRVQAVWDAAGAKPLDTFVTSDAPEHDDYRRVGMAMFTPKIVQAMNDKMETLSNTLIDAFVDNAETDFLANFAGMLPATVIADEFGIPRSDQPRFKAWTDAIILLQTPNQSEDYEIEQVEKIIDMFKYLETYLRKVATDDHSGRVIRHIATMTKRDGSDFDMLERIWMTIASFVGGNETTVNSLMMGMKKLALNPKLQAELRNDLSNVPAFVEEMLRLEAPVQAMVRVTLEDVEVQGTLIPKGAHVILCAGAANRDESLFEHAEEFRLDRKNGNRHLSFGKGRHVCIGMHLARRELRIAFTALLTRLNNIELAIPETDIQQLPLPFHRAIANLSIRYTAIKI